MTITKEEYEVYSSYTCGLGGGFRSQEKCFEILNERRTSKKRYDSYRQDIH